MNYDVSEPPADGMRQQTMTNGRRLAHLLLMAWAVTFVGGCGRGVLYDASNLPPQFLAPHTSSLQNVDLSQLARTVGDTESLYPGDIIEVSIATGLEAEKTPSWRMRIGEDGAVDVPLVGKVQVAGMTVTQAEHLIRDESIRRGKFVAPNVSVLLAKRRSHRVTVVGAVEKPNTYEISATSSDVLSAIVQAGGLTESAGTVVEVKHPPTPIPLAYEPAGPGAELASMGNDQFGNRPQPPQRFAPPRTVRIDLENPTTAASHDLQLQDGSTVMVRKKPKRFIHVIGLVNKADQFEIPEGHELRLLDGIALAGGRTLSIADKVHIIRQIPNQPEPVVIQASVSNAKRDTSSNIRLAAGDVISVEETPTTFVVGTIREFVGFGFSAAIPGL